MNRVKQLVVEIPRRSLWQVLMVYLGSCWAVLEASDQVIERYLLPEWVYPTEIIILLIGLPIVLATAMVREESQPRSSARSTAEPDGAATGGVSEPRVETPAAGPGPVDGRSISLDPSLFVHGSDAWLARL